MTELEFTIARICARRGVRLSKIESVAFNVVLTFGIANDTYILPVVANTFYWMDRMNCSQASLTGVPRLRLTTNSAQGSAGDVDIVINAYNPVQVLAPFECDSFRYVAGSHSAGSIYLYGAVFKITYA